MAATQFGGGGGRVGDRRGPLLRLAQQLEPLESPEDCHRRRRLLEGVGFDDALDERPQQGHGDRAARR